MIRPELIPAAWPRVCPFCTRLDDVGATERELWEHITIAHDAATEVAAVFADLDLDSDSLDELARGRAA